MAAAPQAPLRMTVAEFERLDPEGRRVELLDGFVTERGTPNREHRDLQDRIAGLLKSLLGGNYIVRIELEFRPAPEFTMPISDIAAVSWSRYQATPRKGYLVGAPELVIEVVSPGNQDMRMRYKRQLALDHGCRQFWIVNPDLKLVEVSVPGPDRRDYRLGETIPLDVFGVNGGLLVDLIFADDENEALLPGKI